MSRILLSIGWSNARTGDAEHVAHVGHLGRAPVADCLGERTGDAEHVAHVGHLGRVPVADCLVERTGDAEHVAHERLSTPLPRFRGSGEEIGLMTGGLSRPASVESEARRCALRVAPPPPPLDLTASDAVLSSRTSCEASPTLSVCVRAARAKTFPSQRRARLSLHARARDKTRPPQELRL
jgi:hypothetical protein